MLTPHSKITVRYTTNPADMGYDGTPSNWLTAPGETMGVKHASSFSSHDIPSRIGHGTFFRIQYRNGERIVKLSEIEDIVIDMNYKKEFGKY